jgi:(p)ppGpp synthase/HD superfamily hydrolase
MSSAGMSILQSIIVCGKLELQNKTEDKKMAYSIDVAAARALATKAHEGQTDKAGLPYITHPERVALRMESPELQVIGWLHDTVEDTTLTVKDIAERFGPETAAAVDAISRRDGEKWSGYLDRVAANPMARQVKISDLIDNSNLSRIPHVTLKDVERQKKYNKALKKLLEEE